MIRQRRRALAPFVDRLDDRCLLSGLTPAQVTHAYGLDAITFNANGQTIKGDGSGQTIAIIDAFHDPNLATALHTFDQRYNLPDPELVQIDQANGRTNDGWEGEEALDVEWAHAIAPGAKIVVVEANSANFKDLLGAVDLARNLPGVGVISMSWEGTEASGLLKKDFHFATPPGHGGITFIVASGDDGSQGGAEWPAASSLILSVGGTTLQVDENGGYVGESAWSGSSGGFSKFFAEPGFQGSVQASGRRSTPDVAFDGDPGTGVAAYSISPSSGVGSWQQIGGTSLGAPAWAGIIAIADQGRATRGVGTLNGGSETLPLLYSLPSSDFHKSGSLTSTGLGTPNGAALVNDLAFSAVPANLATTGSAQSRLRKAVRHDRFVHSLAVLHDAALSQLASRSLRRP